MLFANQKYLRDTPSATVIRAKYVYQHAARYIESFRFKLPEEFDKHNICGYGSNTTRFVKKCALVKLHVYDVKFQTCQTIFKLLMSYFAQDKNNI